MEELLFFLLFLFIVGVNLLLKGKAAFQKAFDSSSPQKHVKSLHKKVLSEQKYLRRSEKRYSSAVSQTCPQAQIQPQPAVNVSRTQVSTVEYPKRALPQKTENKRFNFDKKSLKDAFVMKEILDFPLALR
jgi:hypothetical protein